MSTRRLSWTLVVACVASLACGEEESKDGPDPGADSADVADGDDGDDRDDGAEEAIDADGDGHPAGPDCDDDDPLVNPDATELCDGIDNDCDGRIDQDAVDGTPWYLDADDDGYGDPAASVVACAAPPDHSAHPGDCDDTTPAVNPRASEVCDGAGIDEDCDGLADCDDSQCAAYVICMEDCDNGVDDNDDGLVDCDDDDCAHHPSCVEDCGNGVDDDNDGLVDCEDGECTRDPSCVEDCENGLDDDDDGLIDCEDAYCMGTPTCGSFSVQITGGHLRTSRTWDRHSSVTVIEAQSMSGTVRALTTGGGIGTCTFSEVSHRGTKFFSGFGRRPPTGTITGDCGMSLTSALPVELNGTLAGVFSWGTAWFGARMTATSRGWYGARVLTNSSRTSHYMSTSGWIYSYSGSVTQSFTLGGTSASF